MNIREINFKELYESLKEEIYASKVKNGEKGYAVIDKVNDKVYYENGGFFLCGFIALGFKCKTKENRELLKVFREQNFDISSYYYGGKIVYFGYENGMYEIGREAIGMIINMLNKNGYNVYSLSNLD